MGLSSKTSKPREPVKPLRLAVWGLGRHAVRTVLPSIAASRAVGLAGIFSRNPEVVQAACRQYGCGTWPDASEMLDDAEVDAVYVATPVGSHAEHGRRVIAAGKHLLCEKSLTHDPARTLELVAEARARNLQIVEMFMYLHHPRTRALMDFVRQGRLGPIAKVSSDFYLPPLEFPGYRLDPAEGGSALLDVGCYPLSLVLALEETVPEVEFARVDRRSGFVVDTAGTAVLRLGGGGRAFVCWGYETSYRNNVEVIGERGSLQVDRVFSKGDGAGTTIEHFDLHGRPTTESFPPADSFGEMFIHVASTVSDGDNASELGRVARQAQLIAAVLAKAKITAA